MDEGFRGRSRAEQAKLYRLPVRQFSVCASLEGAEMQELEHLSRHIRFAPCETVFAEEEMTASFYNLLEGVMRLYKLLPDGRRRSWDLPCPAISWG